VPKPWKKNFLASGLSKFKEAFDPARITHEDAKAGAEFLRTLPDDSLAEIFYMLMVSRKAPTDVARSIVATGFVNVYEGHLTAILRRLSLVCATIMRDLDAGQGKRPANPVLRLKINPGSTSLHDHLVEATRADKNMDAVARMAGLASLLSRQLENLYDSPLRSASPFNMLGQVNSSAGLYMAVLERLHRMQMDVGIVSRVPDKLDLDLQTVGAFQTYIGELDNGGKEQMLKFATSFRDMVKARRDEPRSDAEFFAE
jgi:hypothetical protein